MNLKELINSIGEFEIKGKYGISDLWDRDADEWIETKDLINRKNFIVYGDDGGTTYVKNASNENDLINKLKKHLDGDTGCCFDTEIRLIVQNGIKKKVSDFIK